MERERKPSHGRVGRSVLLPARIQRILSMVRADVKLLPCPCSPPLSSCCLAQLVQVPGLLPAGFSIPSGKSGRAREEVGRLLLGAVGFGSARGLPGGMVMCLCCTRFPRTILSRANSSQQSTPHKASYLPHCTSQVLEGLSHCKATTSPTPLVPRAGLRYGTPAATRGKNHTVLSHRAWDSPSQPFPSALTPATSNSSMKASLQLSTRA